jgi:hypothetical protein
MKKCGQFLKEEGLNSKVVNISIVILLCGYSFSSSLVNAAM